MGWHTISVTIDGGRVQNVPVTVWASGTTGVEYVLEEGAVKVITDFEGLMRGTKSE
jgi:hypothetical protein